MKKLINDVQDVLDEQLAGLAKAHPSLTLHQDPVYVTRADAPVAGKVALLSKCDHSGLLFILLSSGVPSEFPEAYQSRTLRHKPP